MNLPKSSVRGILALSVVSVFSFTFLWIIVHIDWRAFSSAAVVPGLFSELKEVVVLVLAFYFMARAVTKEGGNG